MIAFDLGEKKHVYLEIISRKKQDFEISEASYELIRMVSRETEDAGTCVIEGHTLDMLIAPKELGKYVLKVSYHIADQILIENLDVQVRRYGNC